MATGVRTEVRCVHCGCVCATAQGEWSGGDPFGEVRMMCGECARCDKSPPSTPLLEAVMGRRRG